MVNEPNMTSPDSQFAVRHRRLYWLALPVLMMATLVLAAILIDASEHSWLVSNAILIDLIISVPLVDWLIIRKTRIPPVTTVPVFVIGLVVAGLILPVSI